MAVKPIPEGRHRVTPYLIVEGVPELLEFMKNVFDAEETHCSKLPDGTVVHAEVTIGDSAIMMGTARDEWQPMPGSIYLYTEDCDATYQRALAAGAKSLMEPADQFYGERYGGVEDASGNHWWLVTQIEEVSPEEMARREAEYIKQRAAEG